MIDFSKPIRRKAMRRLLTDSFGDRTVHLQLIELERFYDVENVSFENGRFLLRFVGVDTQIAYSPGMLSEQFENVPDPEPAAADPPQHEWSRDGEKCVRCGTPDWCATSACVEPTDQQKGNTEQPGERLDETAYKKWVRISTPTEVGSRYRDCFDVRTAPADPFVTLLAFDPTDYDKPFTAYVRAEFVSYVEPSDQQDKHGIKCHVFLSDGNMINCCEPPGDVVEKVRTALAGAKPIYPSGPPAYEPKETPMPQSWQGK